MLLRSPDPLSAFRERVWGQDYSGYCSIVRAGQILFVYLLPYLPFSLACTPPLFQQYLHAPGVKISTAHKLQPTVLNLTKAAHDLQC